MTDSHPAPCDFQLLFHSLPGLFLVLAPDSPVFTVLAASDAYLRATRTVREEIVGRGVFEVFPENPDDPAGAEGNSRASFERALATRAPDAMAVQRHDIRRPACEGGGFETRYWSPLNTPVLGPDGAVRYLIHRVEDVTQYQEQLLKGARDKELAEELRSRSVQLEADILRRGEELEEANRKLREANRNQAEAQTYQQLLETVLEFQPAAVNVINGADLTILMHNPAYQALAPGKQMVGRTLEEIWPETGRAFSELCRGVLTTGRPFFASDDRVTIRRGPDAPLEAAYFTWSLHRIQLPGNQGWGIFNPAIETTQQVRAEEERRENEKRLRESRLAALNMMEDAIDARRRAEELNAELLREVAERKRAQEELIAAKEAAEIANQIKTQFLANMSHELRTPMTGILGMFDLVLDGPLEGEQREFIETAHTSARSLLRILNDILDLTKLQAGKVSLVEEPFRVRGCLENMTNLLGPTARGKGITLDLRVADAVPDFVVGDQVRLIQVLTNLASNAVKFTSRGGVEIRVAATGETPEGGLKLSFAIADTGIGIQEEQAHLLFQPFSQVDISHSRTYGGTGLGLVISRNIAELMGGSISFTSNQGQGSTFVATLPFQVPRRQGEAELPGCRVPAAAEPRDEGSRRPRLLVAEDDGVIRQCLEVLLTRSAYDVDLAEDGARAVELWEAGEYDVVLMDVQMPRVNGYQAVAQIREKEAALGRRTPIVALTAHVLKEDLERCLSAGMDAHLAKPIDFKETLETIRRVMADCRKGE